MEEISCVGVVDGGMFVAESGEAIVLARVRAPRVGLPGGAVLRMLTQRRVQDRRVQVQRIGTDRFGNALAEVWVDGENLNDAALAALRERGYAEP